MTSYHLALVLAEPLRRLADYADDYWWRYEFGKTRPRIVRWLADTMFHVAAQLHALPFVWVARNGEDWTLWRALKVTAFLLLGMRRRNNHEHWYDVAQVAYYGRYDTPERHREGACDAWVDIEVSERNAFYHLSYDSRDDGY